MKEIIVYSSKKCPRCRALKRWLRRNKLSFTEKSLDNTEIMASLVMRNIFVLSAPALEIQNLHVSGAKRGNRFFLSDQIFQEDNRLTSDFKHFLKGEKPQ